MLDFRCFFDLTVTIFTITGPFFITLGNKALKAQYLASRPVLR
jgi:hypothetical protein